MRHEKKVINALSAEDLVIVNEALSILSQKLNPLMEELSTEEKQRLAKMKTKNFGFVQRVYEHSLQNQFMILPYVDAEGMKTDIDTLESMRLLINPLLKLVNGLKDADFILNNDVYTSALAMYGAAKFSAKNGVPGAQQVYDDLKIYFEASGKKKKKPDTDKKE